MYTNLFPVGVVLISDKTILNLSITLSITNTIYFLLNKKDVLF